MCGIIGMIGREKKLAEDLYGKSHIFVLGRGISYPQAREIALKLKEIPYIHAEGMMAGRTQAWHYSPH